jgi:hypothetical protein
MFTLFLIAGGLLANHLVERHKSDAKLVPKVAGGPAGSAGGSAAANGKPTPEATSSALPGNKTDGPPGAPGNPREPVIRPAVLPSSVPAPDSPNTPVRRPEIVN